MQKLFQELAQIAGRENIFTDIAERTAYAAWRGSPGGDKKPPLAVARPTHPERMRKLLAFAAREGLKVCLRGAGTGIAPQIFPDRTLLVLTTGLDRILELDAANRTVRVQCGATCAVVAQAAAKAGLFYPPDPGSLRMGTIGGLIAANSAGLRALKYGTPGNYVDMLEIITPQGEYLRCSAQNDSPGNLAAGFPLARLFCGSLGALGAICQACLHLLPQPESRQCLAIGFSDIFAAAKAAAALMATNLTPSLLELLDPQSANLVLAERQAVLLLEFSGSQADVSRCMSIARDLLAGAGAASMRNVDNAAQSDLLHGLGVLDISLCKHGGQFLGLHARAPVSRLPELVGGIASICESRGLQFALHGHAGVAAIHAIIFCGGTEALAKEAAKEIFTLELMLNNVMADESEAALDRAQWQERRQGLTALSNQLRKLLDPAEIMIPARLPGSQNEVFFAGEGV